MSRFKLYVSAGIFILLTFIKLALPEAAGDIRGALLPLSEKTVDYRQALAVLGGMITGSEEEYVIVDAEPSHPAADDFKMVTLHQLREEFDGGYIVPDQTLKPEPAPEPEAEPDSDSEPEAGSESEPEPEAGTGTESDPSDYIVQTFLESQAEYSDIAIPVNVSYDMPALPFTYTSPVSGASASGFGFRLHPIEGVVKFHYGTDIPAYTGTEIYSFAAGTVLVAAESESYGKYMIISHDEGYSTLYAHCSELLVPAGGTVNIGQKIALVGETGLATGPHLHFELMSVGSYLNPEFYINYTL